jgi:signal transduction histidine kinase
LLRQGDLLKPEDKQQALEDIATESQRLQAVIENLLILTRIDASKSLDFEPVSVRQALADQLALFSRRKPDRRIDLRVEGESHDVCGQPGLLAMVIQNLIENADKYSAPDTAIEIALRTRGDEIELRVRDHGIGIEEADLPNLFTPFYRSDAAKTYTGGMGLGLAVSKRIVEAHSGRIWGKGCPSGGSEFGFALPLLKSPVK